MILDIIILLLLGIIAFCTIRIVQYMAILTEIWTELGKNTVLLEFIFKEMKKKWGRTA